MDQEGEDRFKRVAQRPERVADRLQPVQGSSREDHRQGAAWLRHRVIAAGVKRMAARDPRQGELPALEESISLDGLITVLGARWGEAAAADTTEDGADAE